MTDPYSRPERSAELAIARRHLAEVYRDPCAHCANREMAFGKAICPTFGRSFPLCTRTPGLQLEIDHSTLRGTP
jgi:hypothetical protein